MLLQIVSIVLCLQAFQASSAESLALFEFTRPLMGTQCRVLLYAPDETAGKAAADAAFERIAQLDRCMSDYKDDSEIMKLCHAPFGVAVQVSAELFEVLTISQRFAEQSGGAFDVTCGPLIQLWRRARRQRELPDLEKLEQARARCGYRFLKLDVKQRSVTLMKEGMRLDLGGIAKGYAADKALETIQARGLKSALVAAGGDIATGAPPPGEEGWIVAIHPLKANATTDESPALILHDAAVSTAGDAEQFMEIAGTRYSHIIDPRTGNAIVGQSSATVVAPRGVYSDGLDTALNVLRAKEGIPMIEGTCGAAALLIVKSEHGEERFESARWKELKMQRSK